VDEANDLFSRMIVEAFGQHFFTGESDDDETAAQAARWTNAQLERNGSPWRVINTGKTTDRMTDG